MPRYAAVDIGSNSVRMLAAEVGTQGEFQILAADRQVTRLGSSVFQSGRIGPDAIDFVCENLVRMAQVYRKLDVSGVRAVATSAVRDAANQAEFLDRAARALGSPVEIISGQEEARLIHLGVQLRWPRSGSNVLIIDVGGGSAEVIASHEGRLVEAFSKPLGAVRLTEVFLTSDPPTEAELHRLDKYIEEKLTAPVRKIGQAVFDRVIATSATAAAIVCAINRIPRPKRDVADRLRVGVGALRHFYNDLRARDLAGRRKVLGIGPRRAELIIAGAAVFLRSLEMFKQRSLYYSAAGVRDGIIADLAARGVGRERAVLSRDQRRTVEQMARRYGVQLPHARKVADLALRLFDSLQPLHKLPAEFGKLLEASAYLHDIGHFVSDTSHHKHSYYLVVNSDLPGFTDLERQLVALLCRYHRKTMPVPRHAPFQSIDPDSRRAVTLLAPLLRIADSLDRGHQQGVDDMAVQLKSGNVVVSVKSEADTDLDIWAAENTADVFREAYQIPMVVAKWKG
ncbi:MAG TPA: Ppx/GppA phosphatase family protein [Bryobacteraceae bacterium]|nr:Ppx/GppA phosphatase family protein [Bryobacteraceae bacterium]